MGGRAGTVRLRDSHGEERSRFTLWPAGVGPLRSDCTGLEKRRRTLREATGAIASWEEFHGVSHPSPANLANTSLSALSVDSASIALVICHGTGSLCPLGVG